MAKIDYHKDLNPPPKAGVCVHVDTLPTCDLCHEEPARYDAKTIHGPWGNLCATCFGGFAASQTLGVGKGQRLTLRRQ